jgi:predicted amidohydrolase YtcJ
MEAAVLMPGLSDAHSHMTEEHPAGVEPGQAVEPGAG